MSLYLDLLASALLDELHGTEWAYTVASPFHPRHITMVERLRLNNVRECCEKTIEDMVDGAFVECGVWRGGCTIMMAGVAKEWSPHRKIFVCDSFKGVPPPSLPQDAGIDLYVFPELTVTVDQVKTNFKRFGLLDDNVHFVEGWFRDTLPTAPIDKIAVLRLDGDLYESTMDTLNNLYPKLSPGGFCIIDDYHVIKACAQAVHEYRDAHGVTEPIQEIDGVGVFWRKSF